MSFALRVLLVTMLGLALVSCSKDEADCITCPSDDSGQIDVRIPTGSEVDSLRATVDNGAAQTLRGVGTIHFTGLRQGVHTVNLTRWYGDQFSTTFKTSTMQIELLRGEVRTIVYHNDFPLVTWGFRAPSSNRLVLAPGRHRIRTA